MADAPALTVAPATGNEDTAIALTVSPALTDTDGSETLTVQIGAIPVGATLSDGTHSFTASPGNMAVDVSGWTLTSLSITPAANSDAGFALTISATSTESSNGDTATTTVALPVTVITVNDAPAGADNAVTTDEDTAYSFIAADFGISDANDSPANSLLAVRIASLPAAGQLLLNGVSVAAGQFVVGVGDRARPPDLRPGRQRQRRRLCRLHLPGPGQWRHRQWRRRSRPDAERHHGERHARERCAGGGR